MEEIDDDVLKIVDTDDRAVGINHNVMNYHRFTSCPDGNIREMNKGLIINRTYYVLNY